MADEIQGKKMSDYTPLSDLTQAEQETYLANAAVTTYGKTSVGGANTNVNVPLSAIKPDVPVTDVTVGGTSVVSNGVAAVPELPTAESLADDGLHAVNGKLEIDYDTSLTIVTAGYLSDDRRKLSVANPVPPAGDKAGKFLTVQRDPDTQIDEIVWDDIPSELPEIGTDLHRGEYLKVDDNSDELVWDTIPTAPTYTAGEGIDITSNVISVTRPVPDPGNNQHRGHVLTVNDSDDSIEWAAPQGGGGGSDVPDVPTDYAEKSYVLGINQATGKLAWYQLNNGSGSAINYMQ